jgi:hypothetical protein
VFGITVIYQNHGESPWFWYTHRDIKHTLSRHVIDTKPNEKKTKTKQNCCTIRVIGCWWLIIGCVCALLGAYNNTRPWSTHTMHSFIYTSIEGGQMFTTTPPGVLSAGCTFYPVTHFFVQPPKCWSKKEFSVLMLYDFVWVLDLTIIWFYNLGV